MNLGFTIKRVSKDMSFIAMLAAILIISFLAFRAGENITTPPYGYVCNSEGEDADYLRDQFDEAGFIRCESEDELKAEMGAAHLDCGVLVNEDFNSRLTTGAMEGVLTIVTGPETLLPELCRVQAVSVVTAIYAPYVTYDALKDHVDMKTVSDTYYEMLGEDRLFGFEIQTAKGKAVIDDSRSINLFKGSLAILIFIACFLGCCRPAYRHALDIQKRLNFGGACGRVMIPEIIVRTVGIMIVSLVATLAVGKFMEPTGGYAGAMWAAVLLYTLIATLVGTVAVLILADSWILVITVFVTILSLGLCPMFTDLATYIPVLGMIRKGLIPYLMWIL